MPICKTLHPAPCTLGLTLLALPPAATYQASLVRAVGRSMEEGRFPFLLVDSNNLTAEHVRDFWSLAQVGGDFWSLAQVGGSG